MKKLFSIVLLTAMVFGWGTTFAQCNIVTPNTVQGFTPAKPDSITQGVAYAMTQQVYAPASVLGGAATVDSIHVSGITGLPAGITFVINPASRTFLGGSNGAICFSGTTSAPVARYPLTFNGTAYVKVAGNPQTFQLNAAPANTILADTFVVKAAPVLPSACDTLFNLKNDTAAIYIAGSVTEDSGWISGSNIYGDIAKAEGFNGVIGDYVNSALLYFGKVKIAPADSANFVTIGVWNNAGTSNAGNAGAPGAMIDSAHVTLAQIARAVTATNTNNALIGLLVNFTGAVALTADTFYVGVILPTKRGDSLALFTNRVPGAKGDGWELNAGAPAKWGTYNNDWQFGGNMGNYIIADICTNAGTGLPAASFTAAHSTVCANASLAFTDASTSNPAPSAWSWSFGDGGSSSAQNPTHTYTSGGTYTVTESVSNNLGGAFQAFANSTTTITVTAAPTVTATTHSASSGSSTNGSVVVTATGGASPYSYAWSSGSSTTDSLGGVGHGTYTVTVTDANTCTTTASASVNVTGIIALSNSTTVKVYPNPATDVLNLIWSQQSNAEVSVVDMNGNVISTIITNGDMKTAYDIHNLAAGSYVLRVTDKNNSETHSMVFSKF